LAHKKGGGSSRNGRDSNPQMLGVKIYGGQEVGAGMIIVRQRGTKIAAGVGVGLGRDHTLFALVPGHVKYERVGKDGRRVSIERTFNAAAEDVWELWTTKEGIESWWGPDGFTVKVRRLDFRLGGELLYAMTAIAPDQIEFMKKAGMPLVQVVRARYTEVVPPTRLAYTTLADFVPGVEPYDVATAVELYPTATGVRLILTLDAMHDEHWTQMAVMGWENELGKLALVLRSA